MDYGDVHTRDQREKTMFVDDEQFLIVGYWDVFFIFTFISQQ